MLPINDILVVDERDTDFLSTSKPPSRVETFNRVSLIARKVASLLEKDMEKPWLKTYERAYSRCTYKDNAYYKRGIKFYMTKDDFKELWFRDKAYLLKRPSIDRIDTNGHYIKENCRYIELHENLHRPRRIRTWGAELRHKAAYWRGGYPHCDLSNAMENAFVVNGWHNVTCKECLKYKQKLPNFSEIGRKGGSVRSERKTRAAKKRDRNKLGQFIKVGA